MKSPSIRSSADRGGDKGQVALALLQLVRLVLLCPEDVAAQVPLPAEEPEERGPTQHQELQRVKELMARWIREGPRLAQNSCNQVPERGNAQGGSCPL